MNHQYLKHKQREIRHTFPESLGLRVHRALSWLDKAEQCSDDPDCQFIFLWIAFNAAYAQDLEFAVRGSEKTSFAQFIDKLVELDQGNALDNLVWQQFTSSIRLLLNNQFVYQPFWDYVSGKVTEQEWKASFDSANRAANHALGTQDTSKLLSIILQRLYTLRNQLMHGGATWKSAANRQQIKDGTAFLSKLMPIIINTMMDNHNTLWGSPLYPVV